VPSSGEARLDEAVSQLISSSNGHKKIHISFAQKWEIFLVANIFQLVEFVFH
jgi:hypothetical protein